MKNLPDKETKKFVKIGEASNRLGVSIDTLRRWEKAGKIETTRTPGGTRLYSISAISGLTETPKKYQRENFFQHKNPVETIVKSNVETVEDLLNISRAATPNPFHQTTVTDKKLQEYAKGYTDERKVKQEEVTVLTEAELPVINNLARTSKKIFSGHKVFTVSVAAFSGIFVMLVLTLLATAKNTNFGLPDFNQKGSLAQNQTSKNPDVLAATTGNFIESTTSGFLADINSDVIIEKNLAVGGTINGLKLTPNTDGFTIAGGDTSRSLTVVGGDVTLNQDVSTNGSPSFQALTLATTSNQIKMGGNGTLTWTPTTTQKITFPNATGTVLLDTSSIPNSALANNKITINAGTNLTGGGDVSLGGSTTLNMSGDISLSTVTASSYLSLGQTTAPTTTTNKLYNVAGALYWNGTDISTGAGGGGVTSLNTLTGDLTIAGGGINSVSAVGTTITVTGTEADTLATVMARGSTTSSTTLTFTGTAPTISASTALTDISLNSGIGGNVLLAGGAGSFGCTVNDSTGDLTCSGNISGGSTGTSGFWSRVGTTLSPATAGDSISTSGGISTTGTGTLSIAGSATFSSTINSNTFTSTALTFAGTSPVISAATATTDIYLNPGAGGNVQLAGGSASFGCTINDTTGDLTCTGAINSGGTGVVGYWQSDGGSPPTLSPATTGGHITTSGNIYTSGTGTITSGGLLTGQTGLTVSGGAVSLNNSSNFATSINTGTSNGTISIGNSLAGAITMQSGSASTFLAAPNTATAFSFTDGTNAYLSLDTRNTLSGVSALTLTAGTAPTIASGATAEFTTLTTTPPTITLTGTTQVTSQMDSILFNPPTITDASALTIDNAATMTISGAPVSGIAGLATLSNSYALKINTNNVDPGSGTVNNAYGLFVDAPTGAVANYAAVFNTGNVGIGTTSPAAPLSVGSSSQFQVSSTGAVTAVGVNSGSGLIQGTGGMTVTGTTNINTTGTSATSIGNSTGALTLASGGTSSWTNTSGNLTISTATSGTLALTSAGALNLSAGAASTWTLANSTTALNIGSGLMDFDTTNSRVGIGTTAPAGKLDITDTSNTAASLSLTNNTATTIGNGANTLGVIDLQSTSLSTGNFLNIELNALTSGKGLNLTSTSTSLSSGSLASLDWSPTGSTTIYATGDLFSINAGQYGSVGNFLNIKDNGTSVFSISQTAMTTSLPAAFNAPGDVSVAYDINFTNPTASYIKSQAPVYIIPGETFNSSDLVLSTYNQGSIILSKDFTSSSAVTNYLSQISGSDVTAIANTDYGLYSSLTFTGNAAKTGVGLYSTLSTSSTTADTLIAADLATATSGIITTGTRSIYGLRSQPASTGASTGGITNIYGGYIKSGGTVGVGGTINNYGMYIANGTMSTTGLSSNIGLYVETPSGADTNYAAIFAGGNVGIGTTVAGNPLTVNGNVGIGALSSMGANNSMSAALTVMGNGTTTGFTLRAQDANGSDKFVILDGGNVGVGTTAPGSKLGVMGAVGIGTTYSAYTAPANSLIVEGNVGIGTTNPLRSFETTGSIRMGPLITGGGGAAAVYRDANGDLADATSSIFYKNDISPYQDVLDKVMQLEAVNFKWNEKTATPGMADFGMIAEQVNTVIPDLVIFNNDGITPHGLKYEKMGMIALKAIQELNTKVNSFNLAFDENGNIVLPKVKIDQLVLSSDIPVSGPSQNYFDVAAKIAEQNTAISAQTDSLVKTQEQLDVLSATISSNSADLASTKEQISSTTANLASLRTEIDNLKLTPPESLLSTISAQLVDLSVSSEATVSGQLSAYKATISDTFKSLGETFLGNTTVAGDFSVDGTLSLTGNSLSAIDALHIQNGPLAGDVDFFNEKVVIDKTGKLIAQKIVLPSGVLGEAVVPANTLEIPIFTSAVTTKSRIFLTPATSTGGQAIILGEVVPGTGFVAKLDHIIDTDIKLNWVIFDQQ